MGFQNAKMREKWENWEKPPRYYTYLIQRLRRPSPTKFGNKRVDQVFAFGGGGSGLSDEAWEILKPLFEFDYMGAAEFEFGAFPKSLQPFVEDIKNGNHEAFTMTLKPKEIGGNFNRQYRGKKDKEPLPEKKEREVYVICRKNHRGYVEDLIRELAKNAVDLKEWTRFVNALDPLDDYDLQVCGWYELNNGFFFFTDKPMFERTNEVFNPTALKGSK